MCAYDKSKKELGHEDISRHNTEACFRIDSQNHTKKIIDCRLYMQNKAKTIMWWNTPPFHAKKTPYRRIIALPLSRTQWISKATENVVVSAGSRQSESTRARGHGMKMQAIDGRMPVATARHGETARDSGQRIDINLVNAQKQVQVGKRAVFKSEIRRQRRSS
jgi:hypothetical protein